MNKKTFQFSEFAEKSLFTCIFEPTNTNLQVVLLMCYPFGIEHLYGQRVYFNTADYLSARGITCVLFDYKGCGDSSHSFEETIPEFHINDIEDMLRFIKSKYVDYKIGLFGMRLGGSWAILASSDNLIDFLILWSPIINMDAYLNAELRKSLSTQTVILKKILYTRDQIKQRLKDNDNLVINGFNVANVDGYTINKDYILSMEGVNLLDYADKIDVPILLIDVKDKDTQISKEYLLFNSNVISNSGIGLPLVIS